MNLFSSEIFYASIALFITTLIYLRTQTEITASIYKYVSYLLLAFVAILFILFSLFYWVNDDFPKIAFFGYFLLCAIIAFASLSSILKKRFRCVAWFPLILFTLLTLSLYYVPVFFGMVLTVIIYDLQ